MEEADIIEGLILKDEKVFKEFVENYRQLVVNTCFGLLHSTEDAEDVAQDVFIEVFRSVHRFRGSSKISTWLYRIAVNRSLNYIRDNKKHAKLKSFNDKGESSKSELNQLVSDNTGNPEMKYENMQRAMLLHQALDSLPQNQRVAITLSKYEDLSIKEIAEIMNLSVSSVESLIHRAKKNLQKKLYTCYKKMHLSESILTVLCQNYKCNIEMKCKTIHKKLIFFIEGDLPEKEMQEVEVHLTGCSRCAAFAEEIKKTLNIVQLEKPAPVSPYFYTRLKARMKRQEEAVVQHGNFPLWERVLQPAMFSVLLLAGIYTGIKIGGQAKVEKSSTVYAKTEVIPFLNEMHSEPLESFLME